MTALFVGRTDTRRRRHGRLLGGHNSRQARLFRRESPHWGAQPWRPEADRDRGPSQFEEDCRRFDQERRYQLQAHADYVAWLEQQALDAMAEQDPPSRLSNSQCRRLERADRKGWRRPDRFFTIG